MNSSKVYQKRDLFSLIESNLIELSLLVKESGVFVSKVCILLEFSFKGD